MERPPDPTNSAKGVRARTPADDDIKTQDEATKSDPDDGHQPAAGGADPSATPQLCSSRTREGGLSTAQHDPAAQLRLSSVALCQALTPSSEGGDTGAHTKGETRPEISSILETPRPNPSEQYFRSNTALPSDGRVNGDGAVSENEALADTSESPVNGR